MRAMGTRNQTFRSASGRPPGEQASEALVKQRVSAVQRELKHTVTSALSNELSHCQHSPPAAQPATLPPTTGSRLPRPFSPSSSLSYVSEASYRSLLLRSISGSLWNCWRVAAELPELLGERTEGKKEAELVAW